MDEQGGCSCNILSFIERFIEGRETEKRYDFSQEDLCADEKLSRPNDSDSGSIRTVIEKQSKYARSAEGDFHRSSGGFSRGIENFEHFTIDVVCGRRKGCWVNVYSHLLKTLSFVFGFLAQMRLFLYRQRIFRNQALGCLVVVVGNLTVGGTGKTPVVEKLARSLAERGRKVAILSRGYKSKRESILKRWWRTVTQGEAPPPKVVSDGKRVLLDPDRAGDEPYMLAKNLPGVAVIVDKDRVKAGAYAIRKFGADTLVLDDGYQYLALKGRLNLLLIDKGDPFGNGYLLPRGVLREPIESIRRASYVLLTKSDGEPDKKLEAIIRSHNPEAEIIECAHKPQSLEEISGMERLELTALDGKKIGSFSAIAVPESFEGFLRELGAEIGMNRRFLDHHRYERKELERLFGSFREAGCEMVVTTEKDAVRIPQEFRPGIPFYYLRLEIDILSGGQDFQQAVSKICFPKKKMRSTRHPFASGNGAQ